MIRDIDLYNPTTYYNANTTDTATIINLYQNIDAEKEDSAISLKPFKVKHRKVHH